jgi:hypothetical protein
MKPITFKNMKSLNFFISYIFFLVLFSSCHKEKGNLNKLIHLELVDEVIFELDSMTPVYSNDYQVISENDVLKLLFWNPRNSSIYIYDLETQKHLKTIQFEKEGNNGVGNKVSGFYYHNSDSIFLHSYYQRSFGLFDSGSNKVTSYPLQSNLEGVELPKSGHLMPFYFYDGKLIINNGGKCNNLSPQGRPPVVIIYDLLNKSILYDLSYSSDLFGEKANWPVTLCDVYNSVDSSNGLFAYSYAMSDKVLVTDHKGYEKEFFMSSNVVSNEKFKGVNYSATHPLDHMKVASRFAQYGALYFDKYRKFYLRFANAPVDEERLERNNFKARQNIIISDQDGVTIGEVEDFSGGNYLFFTERGINQISSVPGNEDVFKINIYRY